MEASMHARFLWTTTLALLLVSGTVSADTDTDTDTDVAVDTDTDTEEPFDPTDRSATDLAGETGQTVCSSVDPVAALLPLGLGFGLVTLRRRKSRR